MKAVFLDRDGVLNASVIRAGKPYPPSNVLETVIPPGVPEALAALKSAGYQLLVVTNQPDVARGTTTREAVEAINDFLTDRLPLDAVYTCYDDGDSPRRKPNPGMILEAALAHRIDLAHSFMVGDRWKDIEAGRRAGVRTAFVDYHYAETRHPFPPDFTGANLMDCATWILSLDAEKEFRHEAA